jgi:hypothetical protein
MLFGAARVSVVSAAAAALVWVGVAAWAADAVAQSPFGDDPGEPGGGFGPSPGGSSPRPKPKPTDAPETHAASGAGDRLVTPGGEPTLPDDPLNVSAIIDAQIGSDAVLDDVRVGEGDELSRSFYGLYYKESRGGYSFQTSFPPLWFQRTQPSLTDPTKQDRASLFGLYYNRRSAERADDVLFPFFWNFRDVDSRTTVIGPWAQRVAADRDDHWLAPFYFSGNRPDGGYTIIPPLLTYFNRDEAGGFNLVLGLGFCSWEGGDSCSADSSTNLDMGVAPFFFAGQDEQSEYRLIPPLLHYHERNFEDLSSVDIWGPVYRKHTETRDAFHIFPFYFSLTGEDERHTTLFPFFHSGRKGESSLLVNPLFLKSHGEDGDDLFITWLYARYRGKTELDMVTPLYWHYRDPEIGLDQKLLLPFYFSRTGPRDDSHVYFPFYANIKRKGLSESTWVTPLFQHSTGLRGWSTNIYPFFFAGRDGFDTHTVVAPFFFDFATRSSRTTVGFPLYWRFAEDDQVNQLIGNVYYSERRVRHGLDWSLHVFPFFSYGETPDGHWWKVLYGLAGYERKGSRTRLQTLWVPIPLSD